MMEKLVYYEVRTMPISIKMFLKIIFLLCFNLLTIYWKNFENCDIKLLIKNNLVSLILKILAPLS